MSKQKTWWVISTTRERAEAVARGAGLGTHWLHVTSPDQIRGQQINPECVLVGAGAETLPLFDELMTAVRTAEQAWIDDNMTAAPLPPVYRAVITDPSGQVIAERNLTAKQVRELVG